MKSENSSFSVAPFHTSPQSACTRQRAKGQSLPEQNDNKQTNLISISMTGSLAPDLTMLLIITAQHSALLLALGSFEITRDSKETIKEGATPALTSPFFFSSHTFLSCSLCISITPMLISVLALATSYLLTPLDSTLPRRSITSFSVAPFGSDLVKKEINASVTHFTGRGVIVTSVTSLVLHL